ncbi:hypothetical protein ACC728_38445, partial [Rhizobium ruizarguesonis]
LGKLIAARRLDLAFERLGARIGEEHLVGEGGVRQPFSKGHPERFHIITFEGAFQGRTLATIAAGGQEKYLEGFGTKAPGFYQ